MTHVEAMQKYREGVRASYGPQGWTEVLEHAAKALSKVEFVRSRYRAPWYGIVLSREKRKNQSDLCRIRVLRDRRGNWVRKPWVTSLDENWLTPCEPWSDPDAPFNTLIPVAVTDARWDKAEETLRLRAERKKLRRQWRGLE